MITDLYFLIPVINTQIFNPIAEVVMHIETPTNEANVETKTQLLTAKMKIRKSLKQFKVLYTFDALHSLIYFVLFILKQISCFIYFLV